MDEATCTPGVLQKMIYQRCYHEANCTPEALRKMIYQQCYQYARSTTPVSLHPAIYYAYLALFGASAHIVALRRKNLGSD
jgi:eukaryotic translation initiation factor 2C